MYILGVNPQAVTQTIRNGEHHLDVQDCPKVTIYVEDVGPVISSTHAKGNLGIRAEGSYLVGSYWLGHIVHDMPVEEALYTFVMTESGIYIRNKS